MVDSFGAGQDNVVFLGRRSFRMEFVGRPVEDELAIPKRSSEVPTEKIFDSDRDRAARAVLGSLQSRRGISNGLTLALCSTTFVLGIALSPTFSRRPEPSRPIEVGAAAPTSTIVIEPVPAAPPVATAPVVLADPSPAIPPARRLLAKPARVVRPRPVRPAQADAPAATPWVDPFAE